MIGPAVRKQRVWLVFANYDIYSFTFCDIKLMPFKCVQVRETAPAHHVREIVKLLCRILTSKQPILLPSWLSDTFYHSGACLPSRHPKHWWTGTAADCAVLTRVLSTWLLTRAFMRRRSFQSHHAWTLTVPVYNLCVVMACSNTPYFTVECIKCWHLVHCYFVR